jgi:hypothetical protein
MTNRNDAPSTADGRDAARAPVSASRPDKVQLISDGVVASYIHDISTRGQRAVTMHSRSRFVYL